MVGIFGRGWGVALVSFLMGLIASKNATRPEDRWKTTASGMGSLLSWFGFFLVIPVLWVVGMSVMRKGTYGGIQGPVGLINFSRLFDSIYLQILWNSAWLATLTTALCVGLGYPLALTLTRLPASWRGAALMLVSLPFWTNFVVRVYAIRSLFEAPGWTAVLFGMVANYLPFAVLPLWVTLERFDLSLIDAARDQGASRWQTLTRVLLPVTWPGVITAAVFVFVPALGEYVIPDLLGGAQVMSVGNLIAEQFLKSRDWPFGSALALGLISVSAVGLRFIKREGGGSWMR